MTADKPMPLTAEEEAHDRADWLVDAVAGSTQERAFLRGDPEEDKVWTESIYLNGKKAILVALQRQLSHLLAEIDRLRAEKAEAEAALWRIAPNVHTVGNNPDPFEGPGETYRDAYLRLRATAPQGGSDGR